MKKFYLKVFTFLLAASAFNSCKLDPILPPDKELKTVAIKDGDGTNTGGDTNTGGGTNTGDIGIGATGTIIYRVDNGSNVTLSSLASFGFITPELSQGLYPNGATSVSAVDMSKGLQFSLIFEGKNTGSYTITLIGAGTASASVIGANVGTVKVTTYTSNNVQGTFSADVSDASTGDDHTIQGSFNVKN